MNADQLATLAVEGMTCSGCVRHVTSTLNALPSVADVVVSLEQGRVTLRHDPEAASIETIVAALTEDGYPARVAAK